MKWRRDRERSVVDQHLDLVRRRQLAQLRFEIDRSEIQRADLDGLFVLDCAALRPALLAAPPFAPTRKLKNDHARREDAQTQRRFPPMHLESTTQNQDIVHLYVKRPTRAMVWSGVQLITKLNDFPSLARAQKLLAYRALQQKTARLRSPWLRRRILLSSHADDPWRV